MGSIIDIAAGRRAARRASAEPQTADAPAAAAAQPAEPATPLAPITRVAPAPLLTGRRHTFRRGSIVRRSLIAADVIGLLVAYLLAALLYDGGGTHGRLGSPKELLVFMATLPCWVVVAKLHGLYDRDEERADHSTPDDVVGVFHLVTTGTWLLVAVSYVTALADPQFSRIVAFWIIAVFVVSGTRTVAREACRRSAAFVQQTLIFGAGDVGQLLARKFLKHPEYGIHVVGFVDDRPKVRRADLPEHLTVLGGAAELEAVIDRHDVERVVIAFSDAPGSELIAMVRRLRALNVQVDLVSRLFDVLGPRVAVHAVEGVTLLGLPPTRLRTGARLLKRGIDIVGAAVVLVLTAPLLAYIAVRIRRDSPGPVFFRQTRLGANMKEFRVFKFRTMRTDTDTSLHQRYIQETMSAAAVSGTNGMYKLDRSDAITSFGAWLRRTSLDELPQLLNVIRGEMSLVGPRPCIPYEVEHFAPHQLERFLVPQGITGLWQVTARANATFGEALDMDVAYVRSWSIGLDLRLLLRTPFELARQRGATA